MLFTSMGRLGWDPFAEMRRMQNEMNRLLADFESRETWPAAYPPVNIWAGENSAVVTAELPGVAQKDLDLTVREDTLVIQARREPEIDPDSVSWHRRERLYGSFSRVVELPFRVDPDKVQARFVNGVLEVELERPDADRPKRIPISGQ